MLHATPYSATTVKRPAASDRRSKDEMPHANHDVMGAGNLSIWLSLMLILSAFTYLRGWLQLVCKSALFELPLRPQRSHDTPSHHVVPQWRAASFLVGLFMIWAAVASPFAALDHELLTVHMAQHLLLMTFAPPLIWIG